MEQKEKPKRRTPEQVSALHGRIVAAKKRLPPGAVAIFIKRFPEYDTYQDSKLVQTVYVLRNVNEDITDKFETLADELANPQKSK